MSNNVAFRTGRDRVRYTVSFELLLLSILVPAGAVFFDQPVHSLGLFGIILSVKAMILNLVYNWMFDRFDARAGRVSSERSHLGRLLHAFGFEVFLTLTSLPLFMWWLKISVIEALVTDLFVTSFVVAFTYVFTLGYDKVFPLTAHQN